MDRVQEEQQRDREEVGLLHSTKDHGWEARVARKIESIMKERKEEATPNASIMLEKFDSRIGKKYESKTFDLRPGIHEVAHPSDRVIQKQQGHGIVLKKNEALKNIDDRISNKIGQSDVTKAYPNIAEAGDGGERREKNIHDFTDTKKNAATNRLDRKLKGSQQEANSDASLSNADNNHNDDKDSLLLPASDDEESGLLVAGNGNVFTSPASNLKENESSRDSRTARTQQSSVRSTTSRTVLSSLKRSVHEEFSSRSYRERNARYEILDANVQTEVDRQSQGMIDFKACQKSVCRGCWFMSCLLLCISLPFMFLKHDIKTYPTSDGHDPNEQGDVTEKQPTPSPTIEWKRDYSFYYDLLLPVSSVEAFNDYKSPQTKAFNWLLFDDEFDYSSLPRQEKERTIIQRYALLVLFFSQSGWTERTNSRWTIPDQHICDWKYVQCEVMIRKNIGYDDYYKISNEFPIQRRSQSVSGLNFKATFMRGSLVSEIGLLTDLKNLNIAKNDIHNLPYTLYNLTKLESLMMEENRLEASIDSRIGNLSNLKTLSMHDCRLTGEIPQLSSLSNIERLYLHNNKLHGNILLEMANMPTIKEADNAHNNFSGEIPSQLENLSNLEYLDIAHNKYESPIPSELRNLQSLKYISFEYNKLRGPIPEELGDLSNLEGARLNNNFFEGPIPFTFANLTNLELLNLSHNQLSSTIPPDLGKISELKQLVLSSNFLSGPIPKAFGELLNLSELYVQNNELTGVVEICQLLNEELTRFEADCQGTTPQVECPCCSQCY